MLVRVEDRGLGQDGHDQERGGHDRDAGQDERPEGGGQLARRSPRRRRLDSKARNRRTMKNRPIADDDREAGRPRGQDEVGDDRRAGLRPGLTDSTPTNAHSGRWSSHSAAGRDDRDRRRDPGQHPGVARRPVPDLGHEVGQRQHHERQRRVVVVLEGGPVDAGPRDPLGREPDRDERQREAPALERHPGHERDGRDARATR